MTAAERAPAIVEQSVLDDLRARLRAYRRVDVPAGFGWERGVDGDYLADLLAHWAAAYDWREHETRLRGLSWTLTGAHDTPVRAVHLRASDAAAVPVVLLHGWPDSILRFEKVLPLLSDVHLIVPALPGFPFAAPVAQGGMSSSPQATWAVTSPRRWPPRTPIESPPCT